MAFLLVANLTNEDRVRKQMVESSARERLATVMVTVLRRFDSRDNPAFIQVLPQKPDAPEFQVAFVDGFHYSRFFVVDDKVAIAEVVPHRQRSAHPHPLAFRGGYLIADAFANNF